MSIEVWIAYALACTAIAIAPGPIILYTAQSAQVGGAATLRKTIPGVVLGDLTAMAVGLGGLGPVLVASPRLGLAIKIIGSIIIIAIGLLSLRAPRKTETGTRERRPASFLTAYTLAALHPGAFVFYAAFFPQFIDPDAPLLPQLAALCGVFLIIAVASILVWVCGAGFLKTWLPGMANERFWSLWGGGVMVLLGASSLAASIRSSL